MYFWSHCPIFYIINSEVTVVSSTVIHRLLSHLASCISEVNVHLLTVLTSFLHLTPAMFLFWHSWIFQLPLTQLATAYFLTDSNMICYGISGTALSWFSSYLTNRTQSVIVNDHISQVSSLSYGVPQGSLLGPILFILYTKPLSDLIQCRSIESQSFADDVQLQVYVPPSNIQSAIFSLETCLSDIQTWMLENKLKLNNDKTEALLLRSSSKSFSVGKPTTISVCGCEISFFFCQKSWFLHQRLYEHGTAHKERLPISLLWTPLY